MYYISVFIKSGYLKDFGQFESQQISNVAMTPAQQPEVKLKYLVF